MPQTVTYTVSNPDDNETWKTATVNSLPYTIIDGQVVILASAAGGAGAINLPPAASPNKDRVIMVQKTDATANAVIVTPNGADTIDGAASKSITTQYGSVTLVSDGLNWSQIPN